MKADTAMLTPEVKSLRLYLWRTYGYFPRILAETRPHFLAAERQLVQKIVLRVDRIQLSSDAVRPVGVMLKLQWTGALDRPIIRAAKLGDLPHLGQPRLHLSGFIRLPSHDVQLREHGQGALWFGGQSGGPFGISNGPCQILFIGFNDPPEQIRF